MLIKIIFKMNENWVLVDETTLSRKLGCNGTDFSSSTDTHMIIAIVSQINLK